MPLDPSSQPGQTVGAKLRSARLAKKYTQYQLAQPDFSVSYISAIERDQIQPSLRALEILARRLDLTSTNLLPAHGQPTTKASAVGSVTVVGEARDLLLLEAWLSLYQGKPERAIEPLRVLLTQNNEWHQDTLACYLAGWAYLECGSLQESEQLLTTAVRQARETTDPLYPCILSLQNALYTAMHAPEQALQTQQESLLWLEQRSASPNNAFFGAQLFASLGRYSSHLGQFAQAGEMFRQALAALTVQDSQLSAYGDLAFSYQEQATPLLAALYRHRWLLLDFQQRLPGLRSEIQHALGHALRQSRPDEAYAYVLRVAQEASARHDALTQASANVHLAACLVERGELSQAEAYVREAQTLASAFGATTIAADALLLQGELAYEQQEYVDGDRCFESGLAMLEHLGEEEELVKHLAYYARLLEERGLIHKAIIYWKRAYENRQKTIL